MQYIAAYDTEEPGCLEACKKIRAVHEEFGFPATFFFVGNRLRESGAAYRALLGDVREFEFASHTVSHYVLRPHPFSFDPIDKDLRAMEVSQSKEIVEQTFERECIGFRPAYGFADGLQGDVELIDHVSKAGYKYVSSQLWGPDYTVPATLSKPYTYENEGYTDLVELPGHGWHENLLKGHNLVDEKPYRILAYPSPFPDGAVPLKPISQPSEETAINAIFLQEALKQDLPFVSFIWHPWSLNRFDPDMQMLRQTFEEVRRLGIQPATYKDAYTNFCQSRQDIPGASVGAVR